MYILVDIFKGSKNARKSGEMALHLKWGEGRSVESVCSPIRGAFQVPSFSPLQSPCRVMPNHPLFLYTGKKLSKGTCGEHSVTKRNKKPCRRNRKWNLPISISTGKKAPTGDIVDQPIKNMRVLPITVSRSMHSSHSGRRWRRGSTPRL